MSFAIRRASSSNPLVVIAFRLAAAISEAISCMTSARTAKASLTCAASDVPYTSS